MRDAMLPGALTVVSGGQTGVDRAALDAAAALGLPRGGWCPRGRRAEDGAIPAKYPLHETPGARYAQRTEWNVHDSDATLILQRGAPRGGTSLTARLARRYGRPLLEVDLAAERTWTASRREVRQWLAAHGVRVLNVAGPRQSECPGIYAEARRFLRAALPPPPARPDRPVSAGTARRKGRRRASGRTRSRGRP